MKKLLFLLIPIIAFIAVPHTVSAEPHVYDWAYNSTNVYKSGSLLYVLGDGGTATVGMDINVTYSFEFQRLNNAGQVQETFATRIVGPGQTAYSMVIFSNEWPSGANFPFRVVDNYGQVLGHHFLAAAPHEDWATSGGNNGEDDKVGIGDVPYYPINADGWHHRSDSHEAVTTSSGDYTFLHYRGDFSGPVTDNVELYDIPGGNLVATFSLQEMFDYNRHESGVLGVSAEENSFIVLTRDGKTPVWINKDQNDHAFGSTTVDNPMEFSIGTGVYQYIKADSVSAPIAYGESVWIVSQSTVDWEWELSVISSPVSAGSEQTAVLKQLSANVKTAYDNQTLTGSLTGVIADAPIAYIRTRYEQYSPVGTAGDVEQLVWNVEAKEMIDVNADEFNFEMKVTYTLSDATTAAENLQKGFLRLGLGSGFGNMLVMLFFMTLGLIVATRFTNGGIYFQMIVFVAVGGVFVMFGLADTLTKTVWGGATVAVAVVIMMNRNRAVG